MDTKVCDSCSDEKGTIVWTHSSDESLYQCKDCSDEDGFDLLSQGYQAYSLEPIPDLVKKEDDEPELDLADEQDRFIFGQINAEHSTLGKYSKLIPTNINDPSYFHYTDVDDDGEIKDIVVICNWVMTEGSMKTNDLTGPIVRNNKIIVLLRVIDSEISIADGVYVSVVDVETGKLELLFPTEDMNETYKLVEYIFNYAILRFDD